MLKFFSAPPRLFAFSRRTTSRRGERASSRTIALASRGRPRLLAGRLRRKSRGFHWVPPSEDPAVGLSKSLAVCQNRPTRAMLQCEPLRDVAAFADREVTLRSGAAGGVMELGLLSNSALNPSVYWTTLLPPLFSGLARKARRPHDRSPAARLGAARRVEQGALPAEGLRRAVLDPACGAPHRRDSHGLLFEPARAPVQLRPRRLEAFADQDRPGRDRRTSRSVLCRLPRGGGRIEAAIPAGEVRLAAVWRRTPTSFIPVKEEKSVFAFWMGRRYEPLHQALLAYCEARGLSYVLFQGRRIDHRGTGTADVQRAVLRRDPARSRQPQAHGRVQPSGDAVFRRARRPGRACLASCPGAANTSRSCPRTRSARWRRTVPTSPSASTRIEATRTISAAVDAAGAFVREHHSWRRRAEQVFDHLANGAAIEFPSMQKERQAGRAPSRARSRGKSFAREPKERFG